MVVAYQNRFNQTSISLGNLKGLKAEGYIRDSTLDQKDGFGPDLQRKAIREFARSHGLMLGESWYSDFISGTSTLKRSSFLQAIADAQSERFDVLLVYHTSRFARNRSDAIKYKEEMRKANKAIIFVSQGIISGNQRDFLNEGINEVLDEQYSRNLSMFVSDGLKAKHESGTANGKPPLGYRSEKDPHGRERKVQDERFIPALLELLKSYAANQFSYSELAQHLNSKGYRNRLGKPFTSGSVEHVLKNRFYAGKPSIIQGKRMKRYWKVSMRYPMKLRNYGSNASK